MGKHDYYSEYGEDRWLNEHHALPETGVYVDVGCAHPWRHNNTAFLRDRGWTGLAIDGHAGWASLWHGKGSGVTFIHAVVSTAPTVKFHEEGTVSRVTETGRSVPARTLQSILDEHEIGTIDYLSVDVEGHEMEVLRSFSLRKHAPSIIVAEYNTSGIGVNAELLAGLPSYAERHRTIANVILVRNGEANKP